MSPEQLQQQIDRLTEKKVQAEKVTADEAQAAEQKARREAAAAAIRADRAAKLAELFATKIDKAARQFEERYGFAMKSYAALQDLLDEARTLLDASHLEPGGLGHTELTAANLLKLGELEMFRQAGTRIVPDGKQELRKPRGPGAHSTSVPPKFQDNPAAIPSLVQAMQDLAARATNPAKKPSPRLADAPKAPAVTTVAPKPVLGVPAAPQGVSAGEILVAQQQVIDPMEYAVHVRGGG